MFKNITILKRLLFLATVVLAGVVVMMSLSAGVRHSQGELAEIETTLGKIEISILQERRNEKDFLARKKTKYVDKFNKQMGVLEADMASLEELFEQNDFSLSDLKGLEDNLLIYKSKFSSIVNQLNRIGYTPKTGHRGVLRDAVHTAEGDVRALHEYKILSEVLMLRRNEKDFLMRLDSKYLDKHAKNMQKIEKSLRSLEASDKKTSITSSLNAYKTAFNEVANDFIILGLSEKFGMQGELRSSVHKTQDSLVKMLKESRVQLNEDLNSKLTRYYLTIAFLVILMSVVIFFTIISISRPIKRLSKEIESNKNDLTKRYEYDMKDELSVMVDAINTFSQKLNDTVHESKKTSLENVAVANELSSTSMSIGKSVEESSSIVEETTIGATQIQELMQNTLSENNMAFDEMKLTSEMIAEVAVEFNSLITSIGESAEVEKDLAEKLNELSTDAEQVKDILTIIGDIADQTNLLALNAAIEAARAGEHGRGFAVVADEVRKLAERTQKSLTEIQASVNVIVQNIMEASQQISKNSAQFDKLVESSGIVDEKVLASSENMGTALTRVTRAADLTNSTSTKVTDIMHKIQEINEISSGNTRSVEEIATATEHLSRMTEGLNEQLEFFKTN